MPEIAVKTLKAKSGFFVKNVPFIPVITQKFKKGEKSTHQNWNQFDNKKGHLTIKMTFSCETGVGTPQQRTVAVFTHFSQKQDCDELYRFM